MKRTPLAFTRILALLILEESGTLSVNFAMAEDAEDKLADSPHQIQIITPNSHTIYGDTLTLNITVTFLETDGLIVWQTLTSLITAYITR